MDHLWTPWRYTYVSRTGPDSRKGVPPALDGWPADQDLHCVFCNLAASADYAATHGMTREDADRAAWIIHRAQHCFLCLNAYPYATGHLMILPYAHLNSLAALPVPAAMEMMTLAQRAETVLREAYRPEGLNFGVNLGKSAGAGVAGHLHMHALPRWTGDTNFMTVVAETRVLPETLDVTWIKLARLFAEQAT